MSRHSAVRKRPLTRQLFDPEAEARRAAIHPAGIMAHPPARGPELSRSGYGSTHCWLRPPLQV